ncbi:dTDP-4-dehydrorhamnose reductase [Corynebacterium tapiri]|uniref:dTDP-4-dehydrorhamnose reductase n=1 Tax=Corynebacterium tapiri TaxID=1448266 RepID=A0A5C4U487_9CORY|nr:dTDP-4-dehydrorhamnose reductase [Corynebacterium tapiri]TNL97335.1 dTDP-4-dehydrorhamnose reductase [Corynebacterium tapiri]
MSIDGLHVIDLTVHPDARGYFKENWRIDWLDFHPVQQNVSLNVERGTTRGLHAEPWDKLVSVATGSVFGAWMDLREGSPTFGETFTTTITPDTAVFVPRGVANGFQALEDEVAYLYLVNDHYSPNATYANVSYRVIDWPLEPTNVSDKDQHHSPEPTPVPPKKILVTGANGQLGRALRKQLGDRADYFSHKEFDVCNPPELRYRNYSAIINTAAYNAVDKAECDAANAWAVNAQAPGKLADIATQHDLTLVHVSTDFVFAGSDQDYTEDAEVTPLSTYGASKAAGEIAAQRSRRHYVVRTSWVIGDGANFVDTMRSLAERGVKPSVVHDQVGTPTMASELARGIVHLLDKKCDYGLYHLTSGGDPVGRDELAMATFIAVGHDPSEVRPVSTADYAQGKELARRPHRAVLSTSKIEATGFTPENWRVGLALYLA